MKGFIINHELNRKFPSEKESVDEMRFYGVLENGRSFVWEQSDPYIIAFLNDSIPEQYRESVWKKTEAFVDYRKNPLYGYFFKNQNALSELQAAHPHLNFHEADIPPGEQFLMAKHIYGSVEFGSEPDKVENDTHYYRDPQVRAVKEFFMPAVKVLSLDIETGMQSDEIYSIGVYGEGISRVLLLNRDQPEETRECGWGEIHTCSDEKRLLHAFAELVMTYQPHVFIGWNVMGFDFNFILRKFAQHQIEPLWGVGGTPVIAVKTDKSRTSMFIKIPGRAIIEGMDLVRGIYDPLPNYKLNTAAIYILNEKKTIDKEGKDKVAEIERLFREDQEELARYNLYDAKLVYQIFEKLDGIDFVFNASLLSGVVPEKVFNPHEIMDRYYLPSLHKKKISAYRRLTTPLDPPLSSSKTFSGGIFQDVAVIDIENLFLTLIMAYHIDPLGMVRAHNDREGSSVLPNGIAFHDHDHILPGVVKNLLDLKTQAQKNSMPRLVSVIDNILGQFITALSSAYSRYYLPGFNEALEANVSLVMESIANKIESQGDRVIYYDNVSLAVALQRPLDVFTQELTEIISPQSSHRIIPGLEKEEYYLCNITKKLFFQSFFMMEQTPVTKHRSVFEYWGLDPEGVFVRHSSRKFPLDLISKVCDQMIYRLIKNESLEEYIKDFKKSLLTGELDGQLIYRKSLNKKLSEYSESGVPPQVVAARKAPEEYRDDQVIRKKVEYCQTEKGPEPISALKSKLDYEHYLKKEFLPALEGILIHSPHNSHQELLYLLQNQDYQLSLF